MKTKVKTYYRFISIDKSEAIIKKKEKYYELISEQEGKKVKIYYPKSYDEYKKNPKKYVLNVQVVEQNDKLEKNKNFKKIMKDVNKEIDKDRTRKTHKYFMTGSIPGLWFAQRSILYEKYGITWFTEWDIANITEGDDHFIIY